MGGDSDGRHDANIQNNYMIQGPLSGSSPFTGANSDFWVYASGNKYDSNRDGVLKQGMPVDAELALQ